MIQIMSDFLQKRSIYPWLSNQIDICEWRAISISSFSLWGMGEVKWNREILTLYTERQMKRILMRVRYIWIIIPHSIYYYNNTMITYIYMLEHCEWWIEIYGNDWFIYIYIKQTLRGQTLYMPSYLNCCNMWFFLS